MERFAIKDKLLALWQNHKALTLASGLSVVFVFALIANLLFLPASSPNKIKLSGNNGAGENTQTNTAVQTMPLPQAHFSSYVTTVSLPSLPQTISSYMLKGSYSLSDVKAFAQNLGIDMTSLKQSANNYVVGSNLVDTNKRGILAFNTVSGAFTYQSYGDIKPASFQAGDTPTNEALKMLTQLGYADQTVSCPITYQRKTNKTSVSQNITYVECHRDWQKLGLPDLNFFGLLNIPTTDAIHSLSLGKVTQDSPQDSQITNVVESGIVNVAANGLARPNEFNTAVVAISADNRILSIQSNLRQITEVQEYPRSYLKTPQEALQEFKDNKSQLTLTLPTGEGMVDFQKVYPQNKATASLATITDIAITYLEKNQDQNQTILSPQYVIRGTAQLTSGYRVAFMQTIPALKTQLSFLPATPGKTQAVAGAETDNSSLQIGSFNPGTSATPAPTNNPVIPTQQTVNNTPTVTPWPTVTAPTPPFDTTPPNASKCVNALDNNNVLKITVPDMGTMWINYDLKKGYAHAIYYHASSFPLTDMQQAITFLEKAFGQQLAQLDARTIYNNFGNLNQQDVQKYIYSTLYPNNVKQCTAATPIPIGFFGSPGALNHCQDGTYIPGSLDEVSSTALSILMQAAASGQLKQLAEKPDLFPSDMYANADETFNYPEQDLSGSPISQQQQACYVTGWSPSIFLYPQKSEPVTIALPTNTTYTDPQTTNNKWTILASPTGNLKTTDNPTAVTYLYYEYQPSILLAENPSGYVVPFAAWKQTISQIAARLRLTTYETNQLQAEAYSVLSSVKKTLYVKISLANEADIQNKLPLNIYPKPDVLRRIHVLFTPTDSKASITKPVLTPISRKGFTVVEVGARVN